jgi:primase-polymerase (primpol)-like protein
MSADSNPDYVPAEKVERGIGGPSTWTHAPESMRRITQWGVWKYSPEGVKWPVDPASGHAPVDSHALRNLRPFAEAVEAAERIRCGLYFDLRTEDPFAGVDLDDCVGDDDGEEVDGLLIHPEALEVVRALGGYCELSPSGTGLKVTLEGAVELALTATDAPWGKIEIYDRARFWTVTGREVDLG